jgi:hypothetical protein
VHTAFQENIDLHVFLDFEQYRLKATAKEGIRNVYNALQYQIKIT